LLLSCFAAGFAAVGKLTSLTGLHVISQGVLNGLTTRPPAPAVAALSHLTNLRELRCEAGRDPSMARFPSWDDEQAAQAKCWGAVLPCMPHITRLELVEAAPGDTVLSAIGSSAPQRQQLVLFRHHWCEGTSSLGAEAIAHVGHIELLCCKGFDCCQHPELMLLPGVKRVQSHMLRGWESKGGSAWSPEVCKCYTYLYCNAPGV
jgi:hypothetical protein